MALGRSLQLWGGATLKELFATHADLRGGGASSPNLSRKVQTPDIYAQHHNFKRFQLSLFGLGLGFLTVQTKPNLAPGHTFTLQTKEGGSLSRPLTSAGSSNPAQLKSSRLAELGHD